MKIRRQILSAAFLLALANPVWSACRGDPRAMDRLEHARQPGFQAGDARAQAELVDMLVACLDDRDPALRDGLAFTTLSRWMREQALPTAELARVRRLLYDRMAAPDPQGFGKPFAALVLAEVARTDRLEPWMSVEERADMVERASAYVEGVHDYRGFIPGEGWRHGVAHGADWLMQLALNPAVQPAGLERIVEAVDRQLMPDRPYVFGEPARLMRPLLLAARRDVRSRAEWTTWFSALPERLGDPALAWSDAGWLGRRHNLRSFLLEAQAEIAADPELAALLPGVTAALERL